MFRVVWVIGGVGEGKKCTIGLRITRDVSRTKNIDKCYALDDKKYVCLSRDKNRLARNIFQKSSKFFTDILIS
jgi:hypothetical protein